MKKVLVAGGAGYIGSHTCVELVASGFDVVSVDNFCNSSPLVFSRVEEITGYRVKNYELDIAARGAVAEVFAQEKVDAVIHFAGLKSVSDSVADPLSYYDSNINTTLELCRAALGHGVRRFVFSSSAAVYGYPRELPLTEEHPLSPTNPYGRTKMFIESIFEDLGHARPEIGISLLRYFNAVGAHPSGRIGEDPTGVPANIMPYITQVACGKRERLRVFGGDYDTPDGTGVRDYIHVVDLARGHVAALRALQAGAGLMVHNLGTGRGYSVLELVRRFEAVNGVPVPYEIAPRRPGDVASCWASTRKAERELGWKAELGLDDMVRDSWRWQKNNPEGYGGSAG